MRINAVGVFFYRPLLNASRYCAEQLLIPLIEKIKPFSKSILGKLATCMIAETTCGIAGSAIGGPIVARVCQQLGPLALASGTVVGAGHSINAKR
jgi:hypothetical protein